MKIKAFYFTFFLVLIVFAGNTQSLRSTALKNPAQPENGILTGSSRSTNLVHTKSINYGWNGSAWDYATNATYKYNADGMQTDLILIDTVRMMNLFMQINFYDAQKNATGFIYKLWDSTLKKWDTVNGQRILYQYNGSNFITQKVTQQWNNGWGNVSKEDYPLLHPDGKYSYLIAYNWVGNNWAPYFKDTLCTWVGDQLASFTESIPISPTAWRLDVKYSSVFTGKDFKSLYQIYNGSGWDNYYQFTRVYDANGGYSHITEQYSGGKWVNAGRTLYYVDGLGNYFGFRNDEWDPIGQAWSQYEGTYIEHTYDANELMLSEILSQYSTFTHSLVYKEKHVFTEFSTPPTVSLKELTVAKKITIYPNPATDFIYIENKANEKYNGSINIYDINGRLILNRQITNDDSVVRIDLKSFKSGMYLLEVIKQNEILQNRLIIR